MTVTKKQIRSFFLLWLQYILFVIFFMYPLIEQFDFFSRPFYYFLVRYMFIGCCINFPLFYISYQFLTPRYFRPGKYLYFIVFTFLLVLIYFPVKLYISSRFPDIQLNYLKQKGDAEYYFILRYFFGSSIVTVFAIFIGLGWRRIYDWFYSERIKHALEKEKLNAELALLKMQVNPHFLFNTLNNIYSLSLNNSNETSGAILKLSHLMRYILEESTGEQRLVCLEQEIDFIHDYIDLYRLRSDEKFYPQFVYDGGFDNKKIAPLLLIPFIENAFKHGLTKDAENPIKIKAVLDDDTLNLTVINRKRKTHKPVSHKTGLENTRKRLQSLYPNKHKLIINEDEDYFEVRLSIILS
jgi:two-component system LytT family sensor kinase